MTGVKGLLSPWCRVPSSYESRRQGRGFLGGAGCDWRLEAALTDGEYGTLSQSNDSLRDTSEKQMSESAASMSNHHDSGQRLGHARPRRWLRTVCAATTSVVIVRLGSEAVISLRRCSAAGLSRSSRSGIAAYASDHAAAA